MCNGQCNWAEDMPLDIINCRQSSTRQEFSNVQECIREVPHPALGREVFSSQLSSPGALLLEYVHFPARPIEAPQQDSALLILYARCQRVSTHQECVYKMHSLSMKLIQQQQVH